MDPLIHQDASAGRGTPPGCRIIIVLRTEIAHTKRGRNTLAKRAAPDRFRSSLYAGRKPGLRDDADGALRLPAEGKQLVCLRKRKAHGLFNDDVLPMQQRLLCQHKMRFARRADRNSVHGRMLQQLRVCAKCRAAKRPAKRRRMLVGPAICANKRRIRQRSDRTCVIGGNCAAASDCKANTLRIFHRFRPHFYVIILILDIVSQSLSKNPVGLRTSFRAAHCAFCRSIRSGASAARI